MVNIANTVKEGISAYYFVNESGGIININHTGDNAIFCDGRYSNLGTINIGLTGGSGNIALNGIYYNANTVLEFKNQASGVINIENTVLNGILNKGNFTNNGGINIGIVFAI